ncbi:F-box associated interaction domain-containing protein [Artemisia annua]|uniref:F-box associated interaction domain-containing protein n=1 Tax=Artemisia annua TaxID=35608 RepID=A0A2U1K906_ARTAN|nr:F-box associated interaction domain-containing protein [Artemisia annua]
MASMTIIPQDIITTHILCRLPAKSVGRFRCVSKEWLSLLSEPRFIQTHQKTLNRYHCIFWSNDRSLYSVPFNDHEAVSTLTKLDSGFYQIISILGSVNGLVLASTHKKMHHYYTLCVLNPTTKDYVELPSLKTNTWKQLSDSPYVDVNYDGPSGDICVIEIWANSLFANGFLHWICNIHSKPVIVAFSLADEKLNELPPPNLSNEVDILSDDDTTLVALGEKLAIFNEVKGDVWLMNEYGVFCKCLCGKPHLTQIQQIQIEIIKSMDDICLDQSIGLKNSLKLRAFHISEGSIMIVFFPSNHCPGTNSTNELKFVLKVNQVANHKGFMPLW